MQNDVRTIDKLINGVNRTFDDKNMWLAPWVGNNPNDQDNLADGMKNNTIFISFDKMIVISAITFWNYAKKPNRGVKELEVFFDENLIYKVKMINFNYGYWFFCLILKKGYLKKVNSENALNRNLIEENDLKTSILFDKSREMATKIKASLNSKILNESNLLFYNEKKVKLSNLIFFFGI